jgi:hypothetical protein
MDADAFSAEMVAMFKDFLEQEVDPIRAELASAKAELVAVKAESAALRTELDAMKPKAVTVQDLERIQDEMREQLKAIPAPQWATVERVEAIENKLAEPIDLPDIPALIEAAVAAIPPAKDGADGKDVDQTAVEAKIAEEVQKAVAAIEKPKDGHSPTVDEYGPLIEDAVQKAVAAIPVPKDGEPGKDGKDGIGLVGAFIDKSGELAITATDGTVHKVGIVVGKDGADGKPGEPGRDGLGFDDMEFIDRDDGFYLSASKDGAKKEKRLPIVCDRGVWQPDRVYKRGDGVSWGGQFTICQADETTEKPEGSKDWRLAVRKGRDAKGA